MRILYLFFIVFLFSGCKTVWKKMKVSSTGKYDIQYLFEYDGCKVYRFTDNSNYIYFTNCSNDAVCMQGDSVISRSIGLIKKN